LKGEYRRNPAPSLSVPYLAPAKLKRHQQLRRQNVENANIAAVTVSGDMTLRRKQTLRARAASNSSAARQLKLARPCYFTLCTS
jgi:hypothetical protein